MTTAKVQSYRFLGTVATLLAALLLSSCNPNLRHCLTCAPCLEHDKGAPEVCAKPTVRALAHDLDELEEHIEKYGSVVAKQPDVWGQARLTKHREEFEQYMAAELGNFNFTLQGSLSRSDQAYFADAFALSAAASAKASPKGGKSTASSSSSSAPAPDTTASQPSKDKTQQSEPSLQPLPLPDQSDTFAAFSNITRTPVRNGPTLEFAGAKTGISVEPTVLLDQRARYLNHLHELRRINEGDDTADSPGYALNLVRIPVSVLPGKCTEVGHGAEVTLTLAPYLSEELLPTTFRNLILNDLVDQIGFPVTQFINDPENTDYLDERSAADLEALLAYVEKHTIPEMLNDPSELKQSRWKLSLQSLFARPEWVWVDEVLRAELLLYSPNNTATHSSPTATSPATSPIKGGPDKVQSFEAEVNKSSADFFKEPDLQSVEAELKKAGVDVRNKLQQSVSRIASVHGIPIPATKSRRARLPFPASQMLDIYGYDFLYHLAIDVFRAFRKERVSKPCTDSNQLYIHLPDVQGYLQEEVATAYQFLASPCNADLWQFCTPDLANAVRGHQSDHIKVIRDSFKQLVQSKTNEEVRHSTTAALAWATIVESALLTEQLVQDMKESAAAKGCACVHDAWMPYFLPNPPLEARQAFNEYVRCRWPIHVFALDPAAQQQNLADTFSGRREMQLSMSLAFVSGQLSARNMMRYARRIEFDFATIDLNGTAIGFSHGDDTFGWRFYPRFQTPDIESNFTVFFRDLLIGGPSRNALLRQRRLEPGMRECVAVVIMPSFVPYATLHLSSNWFKLTNPKRKQLDSTQAMRLSKAVKSIETCAPNVSDGDCYRDGDLDRLLQKAKQLETRLPLQSAMVQIPYENTLGGFAMFNTGVTDLAPELTGWYGSPSLSPKDPTTLFLVGNHFSVHQTRVIAGGQFVANTEMLSRQVMKAVIPGSAIQVGDTCQKFVDVQVATPYGVTQHLLIPVCNPAKDAAAGSGQDAGQSVGWKTASFDLAFVYGGLGIAPPPAATDPKYRPPTLVIQKGDVPTDKYDTVDVTLKFDKKYSAEPIVLTGIPLEPQKKEGYVISGDRLAAQIFVRFGSKFGPETTNPPCQIATTGTDLKFKSSTRGVPDLPKKTANNLTIGWIKSPQCCDKCEK